MIESFKGKTTLAIFQGKKLKNFSRELLEKALSKLEQLDSVKELRELGIPVGNKLEALNGERKGQYSIRVDKQWRIVFKYKDGKAYEVEFVDYH